MAAEPVLVSVIVFTEPLVPRLWLPKLNEVGDTEAAAPLFPIPTKNTTCCGLLYALSVMTMLPPRDHTTVGLNRTVIVQDDPAATGAVQLLVCEKSPVATMLVTVKFAVPELVTVTGADALLIPTNTPVKLSPMGERVTAGAVPVPLKGTDCGLPAALSVILTVDDRFPVLVGVEVTLIAQLAFGARNDGQVLVCEKSTVLTVAILMPVRDKDAFPVFVSVTTCGVLAMPTCWLPKLTLVGDKVTTGWADRTVGSARTAKKHTLRQRVNLWG